jgi:signal transduction histidine kinase
MNISYIAFLALPVFLSAVVPYLILRRQMGPLVRELGSRLNEFGRAHGLGPDALAPCMEGSLKHRFERFMQLVQGRVQEIDRQRVVAQSASQLLGYRQEKASAVLDAIPDGVLVLDDSQVPTYANSKVEPLLGVNCRALIGKAPHEWCNNPQLLALLSAGGKHRTIVSARTVEYTPEGEPDRRISVSTHPLFSSRDASMALGLLVLFRDVSDACRARQSGAEFVAQVSHELKTPLANIAAYGELLMEPALLDESERINAVNVIRDETERATALITNLLNLSKLDAGTLPINRQRVQIADVLRDAADSMGQAAQTKNMAIDLFVAPDLGSARLDKTLFRIALDNLLSNAIKYSDPGSRITLVGEKTGELGMRVIVRDQGIGIAPAELDKVFEKFFRSSDKALAHRPGHGLGLYLARQIIELHHGSISVASELGKGTEFILQFEAQSQRLGESDT